MESTPENKSRDDARLAADLFALAHPVRIAIIRHLAGSDACCNKDVVDRVGLAQSTVSQHLKILVDAGLVRYTPDRQRSRYSLAPDRFSDLSFAFDSLAKFAGGCCPGPRAQNDRTG